MKKIFLCITAVIIGIFYPSAYAHQEETGPVINEVMSLNTTTIQDEDGDYSDWIELYNAGSSTVDLTGWGLSDDTLEPLKWTFQGGSLVPGQRLLVFASDKDRSAVTNHWETVITQGDDWSYFVGISGPPADWRSRDFDDSGWETGPSGFGYGDGDDATILDNMEDIAISLYIRTTFTVDDPLNIIDGFLHIDYDDGFVAYINGAEIARANIGSPGTVPAYNETTDTNREATGTPESYSLSDIQPLLVAGENVLTIQGHNASLSSSDFSLIPFLTLGMTVPPEPPGGIAEEIDMSNVYQHLNFKIKSDGETLFLSDNTGAIVDSVETGFIYEDMSLGRKPDGGAEWVIFNEPTPGTANGEGVFQGFADSVQVSHNGGFYDGGILLEMSTESPDAVIVFTVNGNYPVYDGVNDPADSMFVYTEPIAIDSTIVIRAQAFEDGKLSSPLLTQTYLIDEDITLPVISLTTPPAGLWSEESGIYVPGDVPLPYSHWGGSPRANWWEPWERRTHLEFYEVDGSLGFEQDVGIETIGGWGRFYVRKALAIFARSKYGAGEFNYQLFPDLPFTEYEAFTLRSSGNDWNGSLFKDAMAQSLVRDLDLETQTFRPVIVFINGVYWGVHNMREKQNEHYFVAHQGVDPDKIEVMQGWNGGVVMGSNSAMLTLKNYMTSHDLSVQENFEYVKSKIDYDNFLNYVAVQIYLTNCDWPVNNIKMWRPATPDGKWRWVLFDTDCGFGNPERNTLEEATSPVETYWGNPPRGTWFIRKMMENEEFKKDFAIRTMDHMNTIFESNRVVQRIRDIKAVIEPEMPRHIERWKGLSNRQYGIEDNSGWLTSMSNWENKVSNLESFAKSRPTLARYQLLNYYGLRSGTVLVGLDVADSGSGKIKINSVIADEYPWQGRYLREYPVELTALPAPGYRFAGWSGLPDAASKTISVALTGDLSVTALFEADDTAPGAVVINEINYNSSVEFDSGDWVEFCNPYGIPIDISGWIVKDSDDLHEFTFPVNTMLNPDEFLVLCSDESRFKAVFPEVRNYLSGLDFGFSSAGEIIRLHNAQGEIIDWITYETDAPWPEEPNGNGATLSLRNPNLNNSLPENWEASYNTGTPGAMNDVYVGIENSEQSDMPSAFSLGQNYPNPFNPATVIPFSVSGDSRVVIEVYTILGQRVATVLDDYLVSGDYRIEFQGDRFASGIYIYTIKAEGFFAAKQMMLIK